MAAGVAGHLEHLELDIEQAQALALAHLTRVGRDAFVGRAEQLQVRPALLELGNAADMVAVMVGEQDGARHQALVLRGSQDRLGLTGVDNDGAAICSDQRPDVVVVECGQGDQSHRIGTMPAPPFSRQAGVSSWFETGAGRGLLQLERRLALEALQTRPSQPWLWLTPTADMPARELLQGRGLRLHRSAGRFAGDARCALPFPLPTESLQAIVAQHAVVGGAADFLAECERLLMPGGRLWLFTLNPMSPYRFRWARRGPVALRPDRWRLLAQRAGLHSVQAERYLGPIWRPSGESTDPGRAPWRAVYLLEVEKRAAAAIGPTPIALPARWPQPVATI